jgi:DNA-binding HxlR family transcriptional regulator
MKLGNRDVPSDICRSVGDVLGRVGDKWSIVVIVMLAERNIRFNQLRNEIGTITQKMLTSTLRNLERDGYVTRTEVPGNVRHVEYGLTQMGHDVLVPMSQLAYWALDHRLEVEKARRQFDALAGTPRRF